MIDVILATPEVVDEPALVACAGTHDVRILRRCVDAADLLAAASLAARTAVVVSAGLPRLSADVIDEVGRGRHVLGLAQDRLDVERLRSVSVEDVVTTGPDPASTWRVVREALLDHDGVWRPRGAPSAASAPTPRPTPPPSEGAEGRIVAVWGPAGAPGRTTVAIGLAHALARGGSHTLLVDADTYAPSIALALGVLDDGAGIARAARLGEIGDLDGDALRGATRALAPDWHVLTGLARAEQWTDLRAGALDRVWSACRRDFAVTVVDVASCLEDDDTPMSRRRNVASVGCLAVADVLVTVGRADAAGAARLVAQWPAADALTRQADRVLVANRATHRGDDTWRRAVDSLGVHMPTHALPDSPREASAAWSDAQAVGERRGRRSSLRRACAGLAREVVSG